jgi:hypothetical protein
VPRLSSNSSIACGFRMGIIKDRLFELLIEIEAFVTVAHCILDAPPNFNNLKIMMERIISSAKAAKSIMT